MKKRESEYPLPHPIRKAWYSDHEKKLCQEALQKKKELKLALLAQIAAVKFIKVV